MNQIGRIAVSLAIFCSVACLSAKESHHPRHFSAWPHAARTGRAEAATANAPALRLRRLSSAGHLGERMSWRRDGNEFGFYELQRWTESPVAYVSRALDDHLFARPDVMRSESASAAALDVELLAFEEVLGAGHAIEVALHVELIVERNTMLDRVFSRRIPLERSKPLMLAQATEEALRVIVLEIGEAVAVELQR